LAILAVSVIALTRAVGASKAAVITTALFMFVAFFPGVL